MVSYRLVKRSIAFLIECNNLNDNLFLPRRDIILNSSRFISFADACLSIGKQAFTLLN
ncbi:MAG: hypothetical protein LBC74_11910 [Planctomycetaceae bacterium]|nr:hypothetical protein [Planctomycetaceae bacterium]